MPQSAKKLEDSSLRQRAASNLTDLRDRIEYLGGVAAPGEPLESLTHALTAAQRAVTDARSLDLLSFERLALALEEFFSAYCNAGVVPNANVRSILLNAADVLALLDADETASMQAAELCDEIEQKTPKVEPLGPGARSPLVPDRTTGSARLAEPLADRISEAGAEPIATLRNLCPLWRQVVARAARESDSQVRLDFEVDDAELDPEILGALGDLVSNLLRNAVIYGIEPWAERLEHGKDHFGRLSLRASQSRSMIVLLVEDDGRGWPNALAAAGVRHGKGPGRVRSERIAELAFEPAMGMGETPEVETARQKLRDLSGQATLFDAASGDVGCIRLEVPIGCLRAELESLNTTAELGADARSPIASPAPQLLVVDDSRAFMMLTNGILSSRGYRVRNAFNGVEALDLLAMADFHGVVTDVRMPVMDGIELLGRIRESPPWKDLPVFFVTSDDLPEQAEAAIAAGADGYVLKNRTNYGSMLLDLLEREFD